MKTTPLIKKTNLIKPQDKLSNKIVKLNSKPSKENKLNSNKIDDKLNFNKNKIKNKWNDK